MQFIIKYRWALIGTFVLHLGVMAYMQTVKVPAPYVPIGRLEEIPLVLEPEQKLVLLQDNKLVQQNSGKVSNITVNERDKIASTDKRYDSRSIQEQVEKEVRDFEKNAFDAEAANHPTDITIHDDKEKSKVKDKTDNKNNSDAGNVRGNLGTVSGSYDFGGRKDEVFRKPAYVCKGSGTIVLRVKLNASGKVLSAQIDQSQSSFTESCMGENALTYVKKCKFEAGTQWPDPHEGTVTYTFISQ